MRQFEISVRTLVEFILRSGDITSGYAGGVKANLRALEGTRLHQKLQKAEGGDYAKEVVLSETRELVDEAGEIYGELLVDGRADGIFTFAGTAIDRELELREKLRKEEKNSLKGQIILDLTKESEDPEEEDDLAKLDRNRMYRTIDEIKSTEMGLSYIHVSTHPLHFAQAKCYALFLAKQEDLDEVLVRLSYIHVDSEKVKHLFKLYTREELQTFYDDLLKEYEKWLRWQAAWDPLRTQSLEALRFPFPSYRKGQRAMAAYVYRSINEKKKILIQAPTGIGKTMSTLFPALKSMGEGTSEKVFYLTAKNVTGEAVERAASILKDQGMRLKTLRVTAKDRICFLEKRECHPMKCPSARGHFDRVNEAVLDSLQRYDQFDMDRIRQIAQQYQVCPYELSLDIASWCDLIICDYNYAFDPSASLKRFFASGKHAYTLLVDESHNLVDRARGMYSADLTKRELNRFKKTLDKNDPSAKALSRSVTKVCRLFLDAEKWLKEKKEEGDTWARIEDIAISDKGTLNEIGRSPLEHLADRMGEYFEEQGRRGQEIDEEAWELYFRVLFFNRILGEMDKGYESYVQLIRGSGEWWLYCVDPSEKLKSVYECVRSVIFFSATLTPIDYYKLLLGAEEDEAIALASPFDPSRRKTMIAPVPVSYAHREYSLQQVGDLIYRTYCEKEGHYLVFFPSYSYMRKVMELFEDEHPEVEVRIQASEMSEEDRLNFLNAFREDPEPFLGAAVLGGVFSEGIDLKGDSLIGAVIVTVGLPQIGLERDLIKGHFDRINGEGFDYSYRYPGIGRVLQAVGRVIRTEEDRGVVLLVDQRFGDERYLNLFPEEWFPVDRVDGNNISSVLQEFWKTEP